MKKLTIGGAAVAASLLLAAPFAQAQFDDPPAAPTLESPSDVALQDAVKHALDADKRLQGALLTVSVYEGRVSVNGLTEDYSQNAEVVRVAHNAAPGHQVLTFLDELSGD